MGEATSFDIITIGGPEPSRRRARGTRVCHSRFTDEQIAEVRRMWDTSSRAEIAAFLGVTVGALGEHSTYGVFRDLPRRRGRGGGRPRGWKRAASNACLGYRDPTPAQIRERSAAIRATWTPEDIAIRSARMDPPDTAPLRDHLRASGIRIIPTSVFQSR